MPSTEVPERSAFQNLDADERLYHVPVSKLAIFGFAVGVISLLAPLSLSLLPLSMIAIAVGFGVYYKVLRDPAVVGIWFAQLGVALGIVSLVWTISANTARNAYLINEAGQNAKIYLDTVAAGNKYEALELQSPEPDRQMTGTDLPKFYAQLKEDRREPEDTFDQSTAVQLVMKLGTEAEWQFSHGVSVVEPDPHTSQITVAMKNTKGKQVVNVELQRQFSAQTSAPPTAMWYVLTQSLPQ